MTVVWQQESQFWIAQCSSIKVDESIVVQVVKQCLANFGTVVLIENVSQATSACITSPKSRRHRPLHPRRMPLSCA